MKISTTIYGKTIHEGEFDSLKAAVEDAVKNHVSLVKADFYRANLALATLATLALATLAGATLAWADLTGANLKDAKGKLK